MAKDKNKFRILRKKGPVVIGTPLMGDGKEAFWNCLEDLRQYSERHHIQTIKIRRKGCVVDHARNLIVRDTLEKIPNASHILWLDSDQTFEEDLLLRLLNHEKDIVVANVYRKQDPYVPVVSVWKEDEKRLAPIHIDPHQGKLLAVSNAGTGVCLTSTNIFRKIPFPWFKSQYILAPEWVSMDTPQEKIIEGHIYLGEDVGFFMAVQNFGIKVYCDFSIVTGHVGDHVFTYQDFLAHYKEEENGREQGNDPDESPGVRRFSNQQYDQ